MKFEVIEEIAVLCESQNGWTKELNLVSWNGKDAKYDVRWWSPEKKNIGKGMTLTEEELFILGKVVHALPRE